MSSGPELIRPETVALGREQWEKFTAWVADVAASFWVVPSLLGSMMGAYGRHWYGLGGAAGLVSFEPVGRA